jgi:hypothetical protein
MNEVTPAIVHHLETRIYKAAHRVWPPPSPPRWQSLMTKSAGIIAIVVAIALATDTLVSSKMAYDSRANFTSASRDTAHVIVDGLHVAIPNDLGHAAIKEMIPLP